MAELFYDNKRNMNYFDSCKCKYASKMQCEWIFAIYISWKKEYRENARARVKVGAI